MKFKVVVISYILFSCFASTANATVNCNGTTACNGPAKEVLSKIFPSNGSDGVVLLTSSVVVAGLPCSGANGGNNVRLERSHKSFEETYALVLASFMSNENIIVRIDTNQAVCTVGYIAVEN